MIHMTIDVLGVITLGVIVGFLGMLIYHILLAFVKAWSWHRWALKISRMYSNEVMWKRLPMSFLIMWWEMFADCTDNYYSDKGRWDGIGNWVIYPKGNTPKAEVKNMGEEE